MPEVETAPTEKTGVGPTSAKSTFGDKYRAEFAKIEAQTRGEEAPKEEPKQPEPEVKPEPETKPEVKSEPETKPEIKPEPEAPAKIESPLDAVIAKGKPEEKAEEPEILKEFDEAKPDWKRARGVMKEQSQKIKELESKLSAPKTSPDEVTLLTKKTEELEAALAERNQAIKAINAEYSPEYQGLLKERENQLTKIASRAKAFGADGEALAEAVQMPMGKVRTAQIKEAMAELDSDDKARLHTLIENLESHDEKIQEFRKDLPRQFDQMAAARETQMREQQAQAVKQLETEFVKISEQLPDSIVTFREVPDDVPGGTEWNNEIQEAKATALRVLKPNGADFNESVSIALKGARYDTLEKRYLALHSDHLELKKRMAEYDSSGPDFKGTSKPTVKTPKKPIDKYNEALAARQRAMPDEV